jgi:hypothetical protein
MKYESLFNGTLGDWKTKPVSFQPKEGETPLPRLSYPSVKNTQKNVLIKEIERRCKLEVLEQQQVS